jgi:hypothetical protein
MIARLTCFAPFHDLLLAWHECGENPAFFCYRISQNVAARLRPPSCAASLDEPAQFQDLRIVNECSNPSVILSTPCMTSQD